MKFNFFGKRKDVPPTTDNKKNVLTGAGVFVAGMAAGMSDSKLPETPNTQDAAEKKIEYTNIYTAPEAFDLKKEFEASAVDEGEVVGYEGPDDFSFEALDTVPDNGEKYGYRQIGTRKLAGAERAYYGSERTSETGPFSATRGPNDPVYTLGNVFPGMGAFALFENYGPNGMAHLVELPSNLQVFKKNGKVYAVVCGNLLNLRYAPETKAPEKVGGDGNKNKKEIKENYDGYKMVRKDTYENGDMILSFELYQGTHKVDFIGPVYLIKDRGRYAEVDSYTWEHPNSSYGRGRLLPTEMPLRDEGVRKFRNRDTGEITTDALSIPTDDNGNKLSGKELRAALVAKHLY